MGYNTYILINGVYWGYNPLILTFDPNFLGHPSGGGDLVDHPGFLGEAPTQRAKVIFATNTK